MTSPYAPRRATGVQAIAAYLERHAIPGPPHDPTPAACARQLAAAMIGLRELGDGPDLIIGGLAETIARWCAGAGYPALRASEHARAIWRIWRVCGICHPNRLGEVLGLVRSGVDVRPLEDDHASAPR